MADSLTTLRQRVRDEIGDIESVVTDAVIDPWLNEGQARLGVYQRQTGSLTWAGGATSIALPADFHHEDELLVLTGSLPAFRIWDGTLYPVDDSATAGSATLFYWSEFPTITASAASELSALGDSAIVSFAVTRFYKMLSSNRADYRRYSTILQTNGVGVDEIDVLGERHFADFNDARTTLQAEQRAYRDQAVRRGADDAGVLLSGSLADLRAAVRQQLGDSDQLLDNSSIDRWLNEGQARLGIYLRKTSDLTWADDAATITLPTDLHHTEEIVYDTDSLPLPSFRIWGPPTAGAAPVLYPNTPENVTAGAARLFYHANYPAITSAADSQLSVTGNGAIVAFAVHRFWKLLASSRADFRRYATLAEANGAALGDLDAFAQRSLNDFTEARDALQEEQLDPFQAFYTD